jgi:hypothetical protein
LPASSVDPDAAEDWPGLELLTRPRRAQAPGELACRQRRDDVPFAFEEHGCLFAEICGVGRASGQFLDFGEVR